MERKKPCAGEFYRHFKGNLYQIIGVAYQADNMEETVVYQALYGDYRWYVRSLKEFVSSVDAVKYPEHAGEWRFTRVVFGEAAERFKQQTEPETVPEEKLVSPVSEKLQAESSSLQSEQDTAKLAENIEMREITSSDFDEQAGEVNDMVRPELLRFLDAQSASEKLQVLRQIRKTSVDTDLLTNMEISLDLMPDDKETLERRLELIELNLEKRVRYEGGRLR